MRTVVFASLVLCLANISTESALADKWAPPEPAAYTSKSGKFRLTTKFEKGEWGPALGTLVRSDMGEEKIVWCKDFANVFYKALVSDDGHVVTLDKYEGLGNKHALVFYDREGTLLKDYELEQFLTNEEIKQHVPHSVSSRYWHDHGKAKFEFIGDGRQLVVKMDWGKVIRFDLGTGKVIGVKLPKNNVIGPEFGDPADGDRAKPSWAPSNGTIILAAIALVVVLAIAFLVWKKRRPMNGDTAAANTIPR